MIVVYWVNNQRSEYERGPFFPGDFPRSFFSLDYGFPVLDLQFYPYFYVRFSILSCITGNIS